MGISDGDAIRKVSFLFYSLAPGTVCLSPTRTKFWSLLISFHQEFLGKKWAQRVVFFKHLKRSLGEQLGQRELVPQRP